ncbi:MAG: helix-turn-helix domain-containing protein, partial [Magnetococcales bacterium]|nr:helix-turn-helix domain-containing protein [Magnetococcales bacterium]
MHELSIGQLSRRTGVSVRTIRYYESIGLLPLPRRSGGNQRLYAPIHGERLQFIRHCREFGFSLEEIREMVQLGGDQERSCAEIDRIARQRLEEVTRKIERLRGLRAELERIIAGCGGGQVVSCRILSSLADHGQCLHPEHGGIDADEHHWR